MLDQNTDRMWFVIGAVIVGAAIIFIANGTLPDIFASVTSTFQESSDMATSLISEGGVNMLGNDSNDWVAIHMPNTSVGGVYPNTFISLEEYGLSAGDTITYSGTFRSGEHEVAPRLMFTPDRIEPNDVTEQNRVHADWHVGEGYFEFTTVVPENASYVTPRFNYHFRGPEAFNLNVKHVKLEKGSKATPYYSIF